MTSVVAFPQAKSTAIHAVVTRADGTVEDLGLVSFKHRNPLIHYAVNSYIFLKAQFNDRTRPK